MSTVDPRRAGDLLPISCDCRPPKHTRGINRCSDRDVQYVLAAGDGGETVLRVTEDEVPAPRFGDARSLGAAVLALNLPDGMGVDEVTVRGGGLRTDIWPAWQPFCDQPECGWRGVDTSRWGFVIADARWHALQHEEAA